MRLPLDTKQGKWQKRCEMSISILAAIDTLIEANWQLRKARALGPIERTLRAAMRKAFLAQGRAFVRRMAIFKDQFPTEESMGANEWERLFSDIEIESVEFFKRPLDTAARAAMTFGGRMAFAQLDMDAVFNLDNPLAVAYMRANGAARVTNIFDTTRNEMRTLITQAVEDGTSYTDLAKAIRTRFDGFAGLKPQLHIRDRAQLIAVTETGNAYSEANLIVGQQLADDGLIVEKYWSTMRDGRVSDGCARNEAAGWIPHNEPFPSGHQRPLRFPGCRCDLLQRANVPGGV